MENKRTEDQLDAYSVSGSSPPEARNIERARADAAYEQLDKRGRRRLEVTRIAMNDYERIELAFANLRDRRIYAAQDFSCCGTCGWAEASEGVQDDNAFVGFAFTSCQDYEDGYFGGPGTPMPPRIWLEIGHDDDLRDAWWADNWDEARLNVGDLIGDMYVSWYMPDDDPALIVEALRGAGLTVSRPLDPNKRIRVTTGNPGRWSDLESQAIDAAVERLVDLLDDGASDPREAAIQAMQSLPDELLNHLDPARFIRVMVDEHEGKVDA